MDARGYCQDRLESRGSGDVQPTERPPPVPHPRRCGVQVAISPSHHGHDLEHWPLYDMLTLGALADAVPLARAQWKKPDGTLERDFTIASAGPAGDVIGPHS